MITWIASYPRSGNTWLRMLLKSMLDPDWSIDRMSIALAPNAGDRAFIEKHSGFMTADLSDGEIAAVRQAVHATIASLSDRPFFVKVHDNYYLSAVADGHANLSATADSAQDNANTLFAPRPGDRVLYVVRNPADVAVSLAAFVGEPHDRIVSLMCNEQARWDDLTPSARHDQVSYRLGSWASHVSGWVQGGMRDQCLCLRYEDMIADAGAVLRRVADWLALPVDPAAIDRAVTRTAFSRLHAHEQRHGFAEASPGAAFFRSGPAGAGHDGLSREHLVRIADASADVMCRLGYQPAARP